MNYFFTFIKNHLGTFVWVCFWVLNYVPLNCVFIHSLIPFCLDYYSSIATFNIGYSDSLSTYYLLFQDCFSYLEVVSLHINFRTSWPNCTKNLVGVLMGIALSLWINLRRIDIFMMLIHSIHEYTYLSMYLNML